MRWKIDGFWTWYTADCSCASLAVMLLEYVGWVSEMCAGLQGVWFIRCNEIGDEQHESDCGY